MDKLSITTALHNYIKFAEEVGENNLKIVLKSFLDNIENNQYFLPVIGQFSAGKTRLINRLLGGEILPVKSLESTAYITYLQYGDNKVEVLFDDNIKEEVSFETLKILDQQESEMRTQKINSIDVYLNNPIFKNGLILIDTPGINTLINDHAILTESVLSQSYHIIYVLAKAVTEEDLKLIKKLKILGIKFLFVRTKLDEIKLNEELRDEAINNDKFLLSKIIGDDLIYFALSNLDGICEEEPWKQKFIDFNKYISQNLANNTEKIFFESFQERLIYIKNVLIKKLEDSKALIESNSQKHIHEIEGKQIVLERQLNIVKKEIKLCEKEIFNLIPDQLIEIKSTTKKILESFLINFEKEFKIDHKKVNNAQEFLNPLLESSYEKAKDLMLTLVEQSISIYAKTSLDKFDNIFENIKSELSDEKIEFNLNFDLDTFLTDSEINNHTLAKFYENREEIEKLINKKDAEIEQVGSNQHQLKELLTEMDKIAEELKGQENEINSSYSPQYLSKGGNTGSILGRIGTVVDLAMIFIPATGFAKAGTLLASKASTLAKGGKIAGYTAKALTGGSNAMKLLAKTDKIKDIVKAGEMVADATKNGNIALQKVSNTLALLSVSHWMEQAGNFIDPKSTFLDEEYERTFQASKQNIINEQNNLRRKKLEELYRIGLLETEAAKVKKEKELAEKDQIELDRRLKEEQLKLRSEALKKYHEKLKVDSIKTLRERLTNLHTKIIYLFQGLLEDISKEMILSANKLSITKLENINIKLSEIIQDKQNNIDTLSEFEDKYNSLISSI